MRIDPIEVVALKKLALISGALAASLSDYSAAREQRSLTRVLIDVVHRAEIENATHSVSSNADLRTIDNALSTWESSND